MNHTTNTQEVLSQNNIIHAYNVSDLPLYLNREELNKLPLRKTIPHWEQDMVTLYIEKGCMNITANGVTHLLKERDICIIESGCLHFLESYNEENCFYYCGIANESLFSASEGILRKYINPIYRSPHPKLGIISAGSEYSDRLTRIFRDIYACLENQPPAFDLLVVAKFYEYLALLCTALEKPVTLFEPIDCRATDSLKKMLTYIRDNYHTKITTEKLCEVGIVSRNHCFQLFTEYTGETPANYILNYRLNVARSMLTDSNLPISQIAMGCGFAQQSHFTHHFARHFGITPLQFRKLNTLRTGQEQ